MTDAFAFLDSLDLTVKDRLYQCPWTCQAQFRSLPSLAKQYALRLLCVTSFTKDSIESWTSRNQQIAHQAAIDKLLRSRVCIQDDQQIKLNPIVQQNLKQALSSDYTTPWEREKLRLKEDTKAPTQIELEKHSKGSWESILHFLVGSPGATQPPPNSIKRLLVKTKLMQVKPTSVGGVTQHSFVITSLGYEFMLKDIHLQMWIFMMEYIKMKVETNAAALEEILKFLFQLSFCRVGDCYPVKPLSESQQDLLDDFHNMGIVFRRKSGSKRFYTTKLAVNLVCADTLASRIVEDPMHAGDTEGSAETSPLRIIVESNFKVYAFTESILHIYLLSIFVKIRYRLPNMTVGLITRESAREALQAGITTAQILHFLQGNAHPQMMRNDPVIPENVSHQLTLWAGELVRVNFTACVLYDDFSDPGMFEKVRQYAEEHGCLVWANAESGTNGKLTVTNEGHNTVLKFARNNR